MTMNILYFYFHLGPKILHKKFHVILSKIKGCDSSFCNIPIEFTTRGPRVTIRGPPKDSKSPCRGQRLLTEPKGPYNTLQKLEGGAYSTPNLLVF